MRPREKAVVPEQDHQTAFGICPTCNARQIVDFSIGRRGELVETLPCGCSERDGSVCDAVSSQPREVAPNREQKADTRNRCTDCGIPCRGEVRCWPCYQKSIRPPVKLCPVCNTNPMRATSKYSCKACAHDALRARLSRGAA